MYDLTTVFHLVSLFGVLAMLFMLARVNGRLNFATNLIATLNPSHQKVMVDTPLNFAQQAAFALHCPFSKSHINPNLTLPCKINPKLWLQLYQERGIYEITCNDKGFELRIGADQGSGTSPRNWQELLTKSFSNDVKITIRA